MYVACTAGRDNWCKNDGVQVPFKLWNEEIKFMDTAYIRLSQITNLEYILKIVIPPMADF
jgi:hypothetical protein